MDLRRFSIDVMLRRAGSLPDPALDGYTEMNARVAWRPTDRIEVAVKGFNLLNETHREYAEPEGRLIRRSVMAELRYSY
jgi:iron complex outermembrane receptor protein